MKNLLPTAKITWHAFKQMLLVHPHMSLQFEYADGVWVNGSYHITEIKQASILSVDCGGQLNAWTEIIVQLLEPNDTADSKAMTADKALKIIDLVESKVALNTNGEVKIEFGNSQFDTRQMYPAGFRIAAENLIVDLVADQPQCKAIGRNETCGPKPEKVAAACCTPNTGCC